MTEKNVFFTLATATATDFVSRDVCLDSIRKWTKGKLEEDANEQLFNGFEKFENRL